MRTTHTPTPSTSKRACDPGFTSETEHTRTSGTGPRDRVAVFDLLDDAPAERRDERRQRQSLEHVVEEAEHDEPLRLGGRNTACREVVELVVVDGANGAGV